MKSKYSSDESSDPSSSRSLSGKQKIKKSWPKQNAAANDEKIKNMEVKIDNSVRDLNNSLNSLSANQFNDRDIKTEIKYVENETKDIKNKFLILDKNIKQGEDVLKSIDEATQQNKSEIRSVITKCLLPAKSRFPRL